MASSVSLLSFLDNQHNGKKVGSARGQKKDRQEEHGFEEQDTALSKIYDDYQTYLSNLMTMGTLIVGFIATGAFLGVQFTGTEDFRASGRLQKFIEAGLKGAVSSMVAVVMTFLFSTVASNHRLHHGLKGALRIVRQAMLLAGFAEILIYVSFVQYLTCMEEYSLMNYLGPDICPFHTAAESHGTAFQRNSSACANTGKDLYNAAKRKCGDPQNVTFRNKSDIWGTQKLCQATTRNASDFACRVYDCYSRSESFQSHTAIDFGWRGVPITLMTADFGYDQFQDVSIGDQLVSLNEKDKQLVTKHKEISEARISEAFQQVIDTNSKVHCGQDDAEDEVHALCNRAKKNVSSTFDDRACSTARVAWAQSQQCTQATTDGALQCHKVCAWVVNKECEDRLKAGRFGQFLGLTTSSDKRKCIRTARETIKSATVEQIFYYVLIGLWFIVAARSIAVVGRLGLLLREILHEKRKSCSCVLLYVDVFGIVAMLHDCYAQLWLGTGNSELEMYAMDESAEDSL